MDDILIRNILLEILVVITVISIVKKILRLK